MFDRTAKYYDLVYGSKDYRAEVERLRSLLGERGLTDGSLLDVACGTGRHLEFLRESFEVEGLDICPDLLEAARRRNPAVRFHEADMTAFDLGRTFDVVTCLFSSIGYTRDLPRLQSAVEAMARHVGGGGFLAIEPWFTPGTWQAGTVHAILAVDRPDLKIARVNTSCAVGRLSYFDLHYLIATPEGTEHVVERHELGLFDEAEMRSAIDRTGLLVDYVPEGLTGRGLWIGRRPEP